MQPHTQKSTSDRNLKPAGALGRAGQRATDPYPNLFLPSPSAALPHSKGRPLAVARAPEGADGGFEQGRRSPFVDHLIDEPPMDMRDPLASYLLSLSRSPSSAPEHILNQRSTVVHQEPIWTPPSSVTPGIRIPLQLDHSRNISRGRPASLPLTPTSLDAFPSPHITEPRALPAPTPERIADPIQLIHDLFPSHAHVITPSSHALEVVTPPGYTTHGFIHDTPSTGRSVYVHIPSFALLSRASRPETLSGAFSEVLRPNEPVHRSASPDGPDGGAGHLDIKESLTALLDLACDSLEAASLVLVLDKPNEPGALNGLLHSLMYVGGRLVRPGTLAGGLEWDTSRWVLVGIEL